MRRQVSKELPLSDKLTGPDGVVRSQAEEDQINLAFVTVFGPADGQVVLKQLRSFTLDAAAGPHISADHLRHLEGMRYLVGIISQRTALGHKVKSNVVDRPTSKARRKAT